MTLQKLSAGSGYEYLTRQVAALDSTDKRNTPLADYYAAKGEAPGRWIGSGLGGIDGLAINDIVTAEQMKNLFGSGGDPITGRPLGAAYKVYGNETVHAFKARVDELLSHSSMPTSAERGAARSVAAREFFVAEHGREPATAPELSVALAKYSRPRQTAVAGYDLTFSPVKSVSALWAAAASTDAVAWSTDDVELAILAARIEGTELNAGQEQLVRGMATSGRRVQLALAPAGAGKTTAMRVLAGVWIEAGSGVSDSPPRRPPRPLSATRRVCRARPSPSLSTTSTPSPIPSWSLLSVPGLCSSSTRLAWPTPSPSIGSSASPSRAAPRCG